MLFFILSIGFDKFVLGDDNSIGSEKLSDILQEYMDKGIVEIIHMGERIGVKKIIMNMHLIYIKKIVNGWHFTILMNI